MIRTTKYFDSLSQQISRPPTIYRKPVRIVKAVQRSAPSPIINNLKSSFPIKMNVENQINLSSQYIRNLFPSPDHLKRNRPKQNFDDNIRHTVGQNDELLIIRNFSFFFLSIGRFIKTFRIISR